MQPNTTTRRPLPVAERLFSRVEFTDTCWNWTGFCSADGYGKIGVGGHSGTTGRQVGAHRVAYTIYYGCIPAGLELDHLCRNRRCVHPDHLEAVPHRENVRRGTGPTAVNAAKTYCIHGHEFTPENTYQCGAMRVCRLCRRRRERAREQRRQQQRRQANATSI